MRRGRSSPHDSCSTWGPYRGWVSSSGTTSDKSIPFLPLPVIVPWRTDADEEPSDKPVPVFSAIVAPGTRAAVHIPYCSLSTICPCQDRHNLLFCESALLHWPLPLLTPILYFSLVQFSGCTALRQDAFQSPLPRRGIQMLLFAMSCCIPWFHSHEACT